MKRTKRYIEISNFLYQSVYSVDCTVDFVCLEMKISRSTFHRVIKASTGMSATNYMNSIRLDKGYKLLLEREQEIRDISKYIGFKDPKYFSKLFKIKFGIAPDNLMQNPPNSSS